MHLCLTVACIASSLQLLLHCLFVFLSVNSSNDLGLTRPHGPNVTFKPENKLFAPSWAHKKPTHKR